MNSRRDRVPLVVITTVPGPKADRLLFFLFSFLALSIKCGSPPRLTRQEALRLTSTSADPFQHVSSTRESPRRPASCACRACPPLPPLVRSPAHRHESVCRAQSSYRETVASLRSEERGRGLVSALVHLWHGWQI